MSVLESDRADAMVCHCMSRSVIAVEQRCFDDSRETAVRFSHVCEDRVQVAVEKLRTNGD
jgi:hypothetical protein